MLTQAGVAAFLAAVAQFFPRVVLASEHVDGPSVGRVACVRASSATLRMDSYAMADAGEGT